MATLKILGGHFFFSSIIFFVRMEGMQRNPRFLNFSTILLIFVAFLVSGCGSNETAQEPAPLSKEEQIEKIKADPNLSQDAKDAAVMALEN